MKKINILFVLFIVGMLFPASIFSQEIDIQVSPHVINLEKSGVELTVHTDILIWTVSPSTVTLNGITIQYWKADDCGNFVAKFDFEAIKMLELEIDNYNTFILQGLTVSGEQFYGSENILVIDNQQEGKE